jgi:hypothetical protein
MVIVNTIILYDDHQSLSYIITLCVCSLVNHFSTTLKWDSNKLVKRFQGYTL